MSLLREIITGSNRKSIRVSNKIKAKHGAATINYGKPSAKYIGKIEQWAKKNKLNLADTYDVLENEADYQYEGKEDISFIITGIKEGSRGTLTVNLDDPDSGESAVATISVSDVSSYEGR